MEVGHGMAGFVGRLGECHGFHAKIKLSLKIT